MNFNVLYVIAAKSLQEFILRGDKLRLMIGGSELIEELPNGFINRILDSLDLTEGKDYLALSHAAGGARLLFKDEESARKLAQIMPLAVHLYAPGLDIVQEVCAVEHGLAETMAAAERQLQIRRNFPCSSFPVAGPLVERAPRSGLPVIEMLHQEPADAAMLAKEREAIRVANPATSKLLSKVLPADQRNEIFPRLKIPENIEELATREHSYIAILHADANGLGVTVMKLLEDMKLMDNETAGKVFAQFSSAVATATERAIQLALKPIVKKIIDGAKESTRKSIYLPFRPLVCAGDDVTMILRAQDAVTVGKAYLEAFEKTSAEELAKVASPSLRDIPLTAAAGIVFVNKSFPFSQAYDLCESLCDYAKDRTERKCSSLAFWRVTSSVADDFHTIVQRELTVGDALLTMMPYRTGAASHFNGLDSLLQLSTAVKAMPRGSLRRLLSEIYHDRAAAQQAYERIGVVANTRGENKQGKAELEKLKEALHALTNGADNHELWKMADGAYATPLHDAIELLAATGNNTE